MQRCAGPECVVDFEPKRSTAKYCSTTCRSRANRSRRAAAESVEADAAAGKPEHPLVRATRVELESAEAVDTVDGQLALQIARRIVNPDCAGVSTLSKELRALLEAAKQQSRIGPDSEPSEPVEEEDEVTRARREREQARQAAGLA